MLQHSTITLLHSFWSFLVHMLISHFLKQSSFNCSPDFLENQHRMSNCLRTYHSEKITV